MKTTNTAHCDQCGAPYAYRSNKRFCSDHCRKAHSQKRSRQETPVNAKNSPTTKRQQTEDYDLAINMAEMLYTMPPEKRLGFLEDAVTLARSGECPKLRRILTFPDFLRPNPRVSRLFHRGNSRSYLTFSQAADRYCRFSPWRAGVVDVVRGNVPEPPTGEVFDEDEPSMKPDHNEVSIADVDIAVALPPGAAKASSGLAAV